MKGFFKRPLGLALSGGGALSAWQTAAVHALEKRHGLEFDAVIGFSGGTLTGMSYCLSFTDEAMARWAATDGGILKPRPRLFPPSLCSNETIWEAVARVFKTEEEAKRKARCRFVTVSAPLSRGRHVYGVFSPQGRGEWDGPLAHHITASCSIPIVFPPLKVSYRGETVTMMDGGVACREPLSFAALGDCADVITVEMVRPEEMGRRRGGLFAKFDQIGRETCRTLMNQGVASLKGRPSPPRVFRLEPSRVLEPLMLDFSGKAIKPSLALGAAEAESFVKNPAAYQAA